MPSRSLIFLLMATTEMLLISKPAFIWWITLPYPGLQELTNVTQQKFRASNFGHIIIGGEEFINNFVSAKWF